MRFLPCGSAALLVELDDLEDTLALDAALRAAPPLGLRAQMPAARTILLEFDPGLTTPARLAAAIQSLAPGGRAPGAPNSPPAGRIHEIAVIYDGEDLAEVARLTGLTTAEVIRRHGESLWTVAFNGFAPGFSYLTGGDPALEVPRRASPRTAIPAGSVALAGRFSGIYPKASPGGWQLLGRTAQAMWDESRDPPALLHPGDRVRFCAQEARSPGVAPVPAQPAAQVSPPSSDAFLIRAAPLAALYQDRGREGMAEQGVPRSGALDQGALRQLNRLLGNAAGTAALELTGGGFAFETNSAAVIAVTGAPCAIRINGALDFASHEPVALNPGDRVEIGAPSAGLHSYLGARGGFAVAPVLGSAARDTLSELGPLPLGAGARVALQGASAGAVLPPESPPELPRAGDTVTLDIILGPRSDWITPEALAALTSQDWRVTPQSSRVGIRLDGMPLARTDQRELASEGCITGAIQLPHSGLPVLFLADHPMTGGYPVIAVVAAHHLDLLAQIPPGARLRFRATAPFAEISPQTDGAQP
ncbi:hypothetical protein JCM7686_pAMI4p085 (plasmid) [Paracoccus aminophilus JCM 7686]|uniref:Allophanate hydrolase n=2 Tax=Paracoccus aminophilus TaxID=34003 RepID=S5YZZ2_PARAH|nr:hypothetical protein JCM7686_pAMI4p085 [Paracoccus aminophilus JCM 7686]